MAEDRGVPDAELLALVAEAERRRAEPLISYDMIKDHFAQARRAVLNGFVANPTSEAELRAKLHALDEQTASCLPEARRLNEALPRRPA